MTQTVATSSLLDAGLPRTATRVVAYDLEPVLLEQLYPHGIVADAEGLTLVDARDAPGALRDAEVLLTGWGSASLTPELVAAEAPHLRLVVHTGGSVRSLFPKELYGLGLRVSAQAVTNAEPVAQFATAVIILALKKAFLHRERYRVERSRAPELLSDTALGLYRRRVGVIGASTIGRMVIANLLRLGARVHLYDPYVDAEEAERLGVELVRDLGDLAASVDLLTVQAPLLETTRHMVDASVLARLADGAVVVNTARGAIVDEDALVAELVSGRLSAVLDVTESEPPSVESPLWTLPNVFLTPHLAGALGTEVALLGDAAWEEVRRWLGGQPLIHEVAESDFDNRA